MNYIKILCSVLRKIKIEDIDKIAKAIVKANVVYIFGNGGSMAMAIHFAQDLLKFADIRAIALDNISSMSAYGNDVDYSEVFRQQLNVLLKRKDVIIGFSWSGKSSNIVKCLGVCSPCRRIAIVGIKNSPFANIAGLKLIVDTDNVQIAEDVFSVVSHMILNKVKELKNEESNKCG